LESEGKAPAVRVSKPQGQAAKTARQKECATCGQVFDLQPGQKFFDCPDCYQSKMTERRLAGAKRTRVLTRIACRDCGASEFVAFVPEDPATVLCRACFAKKNREQKEQREQTEQKEH
jgi:CxxC-x17-CxxC domain-containing protein